MNASSTASCCSYRASGVRRVGEHRVGERLDPDRLDERLAPRVLRVGRRAVVDRQHALGPALDLVAGRRSSRSCTARTEASCALRTVTARAMLRAAHPGARPRRRRMTRASGSSAHRARADRARSGGRRRLVAVACRLNHLLLVHLHSFGCHSATSPPAGVVITERQPAGPSRGSTVTDAPSIRAWSVAAAIRSTSTYGSQTGRETPHSTAPPHSSPPKRNDW